MATKAHTGAQAVTMVDTVEVVVTETETYDETATVLSPSTRRDLIGTDGATYVMDATYADNTNPTSAYFRTKDLDFSDQYADLAGVVKTIDKVRVLYEDLTANTPFTMYLSNNGGATWGTCAATAGTGAGTTKAADFWFMNTSHATGLTFTLMVESLSTTTTFKILAIEIEFIGRGGDFTVV